MEELNLGSQMKHASVSTIRLLAMLVLTATAGAAQDRLPRFEWGADQLFMFGAPQSREGTTLVPLVLRVRWTFDPEGRVALEQRAILNDRRKNAAVEYGLPTGALNLIVQPTTKPGELPQFRPYAFLGGLLGNGRAIGAEDSEQLWGVMTGYGIKRRVGSSAVRFEGSLRYDAAGRKNEGASRIPSRFTGGLSIGLSGFW
jgi:hypothetical protein